MRNRGDAVSRRGVAMAVKGSSSAGRLAEVVKRVGSCTIERRGDVEGELLIVRVEKDLSFDQADRLIQPCFDAIPRCSGLVLEVGDLQEPFYPFLFLVCLLHRYAVLFEKKLTLTCNSAELRSRIRDCAVTYRGAGCVFTEGCECILGGCGSHETGWTDIVRVVQMLIPG